MNQMKDLVGGKKLTSREAARLLGVSEASVKRWADSGLLPMEKTAGGHRRFRPEDVALLRRRGASAGNVVREAPKRAARPQARLALADTSAATWDETENDNAYSGAIYKALLAGRAEEVSAILVRLHLGGRGVASLADTVLCAAMRTVGDLWHRGELTVAQEHVATRTAIVTLQTLRGALIPADAGVYTAICCSTEGDFHELPVLVAALTLEEAGWEVVNLGASTPFFALTEAVERFRPRLVCVASTILEDLERAAREYGELRAATGRAGASVVLGGAGFAGDQVRRRFPAELHADSFLHLEEFAATLTRDARAEV